MIRWVFLDVGNVILNDDPLMELTYRLIYEEVRRIRSNFTFEELMAERERLIRFNEYGNYKILGLRFFKEHQWEDLDCRIKKEQEKHFFELSPIIPGIKETLEALAEKYKLGIAANQIRACRDLLEKHNLLRFFQVVGISEEVGLSKPDPSFFQRILNIAGCLPHEAVMVGDRIDNDIVPASLSFQEPEGEEEEPHLTVTDLREIPQVVEKLGRD